MPRMSRKQNILAKMYLTVNDKNYHIATLIDNIALWLDNNETDIQNNSIWDYQTILSYFKRHRQ